MYDIKALYEASSVNEAIELMQQHPDAKIIAGLHLKRNIVQSRQSIISHRYMPYRGPTLAKALEASGVPNRVEVYDNARHGIGIGVGTVFSAIFIGRCVALTNWLIKSRVQRAVGI